MTVLAVAWAMKRTSEASSTGNDTAAWPVGRRPASWVREFEALSAAIRRSATNALPVVIR